MKVTYSPRDGEPQSWEYAPKDVLQSEAEMMEKRAGLQWDELNRALMAGAARPRKVLLWHCMRKAHPVMRWEDVPDFRMSEVQVEFDAFELGEMRAAVEKSPELDDAAKETALAVLDEQIAGLVPADVEGKASWQTNGDATGA